MLDLETKGYETGGQSGRRDDLNRYGQTGQTGRSKEKHQARYEYF